MSRRDTRTLEIYYSVVKNGLLLRKPVTSITASIDPDELARRCRNITIVIPVLNDLRVLNCIASINTQDVEIVVVSNGSNSSFNEELIDRTDDSVRVEIIPDKGIGRAYNFGIQVSSRPWILLVDADCVFYPHSIAALCSGMHTADFVRGRVDFAVSTFTTRLPALARRYTEDGRFSGKITAYSPPLLYRKEVVHSMGGYHFHDKLEWREDREFELRRRAAAIPLVFAPQGVVKHAPLTIRADLRSVRAYGRSETFGRRAGLFPDESAKKRLRKTLTTLRRVGVTHRAPGTALYVVLRRLSFNIGRLQATSPFNGSVKSF